MTVFNHNMPIYRDFMARLFPKLENRKYCLMLQDAERACREKNYEEHPPCTEISEFIKRLDCYSLTDRPLYSVEENATVKKALGK